MQTINQKIIFLEDDRDYNFELGWKDMIHFIFLYRIIADKTETKSRMRRVGKQQKKTNKKAQTKSKKQCLEPASRIIAFITGVFVVFSNFSSSSTPQTIVRKKPDKRITFKAMVDWKDFYDW